MDLGLRYEDYHSRNRARESFEFLPATPSCHSFTSCWDYNTHTYTQFPYLVYCGQKSWWTSRQLCMCGERIAKRTLPFDTCATLIRLELRTVVQSTVLWPSGFMGCYRRNEFGKLCKNQRNWKPILKTSRMTPQLCALYCLSGRKSQEVPIAVLKVSIKIGVVA